MAHDAIMTVGMAIDESQVARTLRRIETEGTRSLGKSINAHVQPLGRITGEANEFQKSLAASNARVIAFGASTGAIFAIRSAFRHLVQSTIEVEKELSEINNLFRLGGHDLQKFSRDLFDIANQMSVSFSDASKAASVFAHHGLGVEETLKRTAAALALSRTSGMSYENSVLALTSVMNSFTKEALDATDVVNRLAAVGGKFAASSDEIAEGLKRVGAAANDANVTLNQTIGLITAAQQVTSRGGSVIGNSFKSIFTRLIRPQVLDDLESMGVQVRDTQGKLLPMIETLRNLAVAYDKLPSSQRSFLSEVVGGVYQINVLKAVMRDLGSGTSVYEGAMEAASHSTDMANRRMQVLNQTISSQLTRTLNSLTQAASNVGNSLFGPTMRTGIGNFDVVAKQVANIFDPNTAKTGDMGEKMAANLFQGLARGVGNFLRGPAMQFAAYALIKLFHRLDTFLIQSAKDLTGINQKEKEREALNAGIAKWLGEHKNILAEILTGQLSLNSAVALYLRDMKDSVAAAKSLQTTTQEMGTVSATQVTFLPKTSASGYIPNLEVQQAMRGGYQAGTVMNTYVQNGASSFPVIANQAESRATVSVEGQQYDFINPPKFSPAGRRHQDEALRRTGIDPYALVNRPMGRGFIPNFALNPEIVQTIYGLGIKSEDILKHKGAKPTDLTNLPDNLVAMFVNRYRSDPRSLSAALASLTRKGAHAIPMGDPKKMAKFLEGMMLNAHARETGLYPDMTKAGTEMLAQALTGSPVLSEEESKAKVAKQISLRPSDVQKMFDLHAQSIAVIASYESASDKRFAGDRPGHITQFNFQPQKGPPIKFKIPTPIYGYRKDMTQEYKELGDWMMMRTGRKSPIPEEEMGTVRGVFFDNKLRALAEAEGVGVGASKAALDIQGPVASIIAATNIRKPIAAMELKASAQEAMAGGNLGEKYFKTFAGQPSGKGAAMKGPTGYVPKLTNVKQFDHTKGGIGILDADRYGQIDKSVANFEALIYAATATGKPIRVHYGPMTTGKTTASEYLAELGGGLGGKGGDYVTSMADIDSDKFKQFIINKTDRTTLDTGVFGLALSAASQVRGFFMPLTSIQAKQQEQIRRLRERNRGEEAANAEAMALDEPKWAQYAANMQYLQKKLGPERFSMYDDANPHLARGFIPNLIVRDWEGADDDMRNNYHRRMMYEDTEPEPDVYDLDEGPQGEDVQLGGGSLVRWDKSSGTLHIGGIYRSGNDANPWALLRSFLKAKGSQVKEIAAGSIVGPRIPRVLQNFVKMVRSGREFADLRGNTMLTFDFSPSILRDAAVGAIRTGDIQKSEMKKMVQAMKFLGVKDFKTMRPHDFEIPLAGGFVPNLKAWPVFPEYDLASPGGVDIRRSSMSATATNDYWERRVQVEIAKLRTKTMSMAPEDVQAYLLKQYGHEYGSKLYTGIERENVLTNNLKGFRGEGFIRKLLEKHGAQDIQKLDEASGFDFLAQVPHGKDFLPALVEAKNASRIGDYAKFKNKLLNSLKLFPDVGIRWLIGNDMTTYTGSGFIPNMALDTTSIQGLIAKLGKPMRYTRSRTKGVPRGQELGEGAYSTFYALRSMRNMMVGKKLFNDREDNDTLSITREFEMSRELAKMTMPDLYYFPKVVGKLPRALAKKQIGKEVVSGRSIGSIARSLLPEGSDYGQTGNQVGRAWQLLQAFQEHAHQELLERGVITEDFIGHPQNTILNPEAENQLMKMSKNPTAWRKLLDRMGGKEGNNLPLIGQIAASLGKKGARMSLIDPGEFRWAMGRPMMAAGGFFSDALIAEDMDYKPLRTARAFALRSMASMHGIDPEQDSEKIAEALAKLPIFKNIWLKDQMFKFPKAGGFVPNLATDEMDMWRSFGQPNRYNPQGMPSFSGLRNVLSALMSGASQNPLSYLLHGGATRENELAQAREYYASARNRGERDPNNFWFRRALELSRAGTVRGRLQGIRTQLTRSTTYNTEADQLMSSLTTEQRRFLRRVVLQWQPQFSKMVQAGELQEHSYYDFVNRKMEGVMGQIITPQHIFQSMLHGSAYLPQKTELIPGPRTGYKQLRIARNSSDLTITPDKKLYVDFLRRNTWMHIPTGGIFEETNPLKTILSYINKGEITGIKAGIIGAKIPNIVKQVAEFAKAKKFAPGFTIDVNWTPADLVRSSQRDVRTWQDAMERHQNFKAERRAASFDESDFTKITGFMTEDDVAKMHEAFQYFGHDPTSEGSKFFSETYARGWIPNLYNAVADALMRENRATGGAARLSSSPLLRTSYNPLGLAAIDSRSQDSADEAISQHSQWMGQSMNQIRKAYSGKGFIPNLVAGFESPPNIGNTGGMFSSMGIVNSVLLAVLGNVRNEVGKPSAKMDQSKLTGFLSNFTSEGERAAAKVRLLNREFDRLQAELTRTGKVVTSWGETFYSTERQSMEEAFKTQYAPHEAVARPYLAEQEARANKLHRRGLQIATVASIGGGMASQLGELQSPSLGAGINEFSNGLTQAGQVLLTFPNKFGIVGGLSLGMSAAISAMDVYSKGLHNSQKSFEISNAKFEKLNAQMDALSVSLNSYETMITDSSVGYEAIQREQRRYTETIAQMNETPEGARVAQRLAGAADTKTKMGIIMQEKDRGSRQQELRASALTLQEYASKRSFLFGASRSVFGIQPFGYNTQAQKSQIEHDLRGTAGAAISNMTDTLKTMLVDVKPEDYGKALQEIASGGVGVDEETAQAAQLLTESFKDLSKVIKDSGMEVIFKQMRGQMQNERASQTPEMQQKQADLRVRNQQRQERIDAAINQAKFSQRMFINAGALQAGNQLDIRTFQSQKALQTALVTGPDSVEQRRQMANLYRQQFGERTVRKYETATELKRIEAERTQRVGQVGTDATRSIVESLRANFESKMAKNAELYKNAGTPGYGLPSVGPLAERNFPAELIEAINTGISTTVTSGNMSRFVQPGGSLDMEKMMKTIASKSSTDASMQANVLRYLQANASEDILKSMLDSNKQIASINLESLTEARRQTLALEGFEKEMDFKQMSNYLGGIKSLMDRGSRRTMERSLVRGLTLMTRGRTAESRAMGASMYLKTLQEMQIPLDPNKNTALSKSIRQAFAIGIPNLATVQQQMMNRVGGSIGRLLGGGSIAGQGIRELAGRAGMGTAMAAFEAEYRPENKEIAGGAMSEIDANTKVFNNELGFASSALENFVKSVNTSKEQMYKDIRTALAMQKQLSAESYADAKRTLGGPETPQPGEPSTASKEDTLPAKAGLMGGQYAPTLINAAVVTATMALMGKYGRSREGGKSVGGAIKEVIGGVAGGTKSLVTGAAKGVWKLGQVEIPLPGQAGRAAKAAAATAEKATLKAAVAERAAARNAAEKDIFKRERITISKEELPKYRPKEPVTPEVIEPPMPEKPPVEKTYKQRKGEQKNQRDIDRRRKRIEDDIIKEAQAKDRAARLETFKQGGDVTTLSEMQAASEASYKKSYGLPLNEADQKILDRNLPKANENTAAGRAAQAKVEKVTKRYKLGRGALPMLGITAGMLMLPSLASAAQQGGQSLGISPETTGNLLGTGIGLGGETLMNAAMMRKPGMSFKGSLGRGGALALSGLATGWIGDKVGAKFGETAGELTAGGLDIGTSALAFGSRGGLGAGIGFASEMLRRKFTEKQFGYTAGAGQGMAGAMLAGAAFGGLPGAAIGGAMYGIQEGRAVRRENDEAMAAGRTLDAAHLQGLSQNISEGIAAGYAPEQAKLTLGNLKNRISQLQGLEESDKADFGGWGGKMMGLFHLSKRQFGEAESATLTRTTQQKSRLEQAMSAGDTNKIVEVLKEIKGEFDRQTTEQLRPEQAEKDAKAAKVNSEIKVDISINNPDKIPSDINEKIIEPIRKELAALQAYVYADNPQPVALTG